MPSHLHPRSRTTTSLFGLTLAASFLVVGMPHILPCPVPRTQFADSEITEDGKRRRRRRPHLDGTAVETSTLSPQRVPHQIVSVTEEERDALTRKAHECPVPKPTGRIGEMLGFGQREEKEPRRTPVVVEPRAVRD